MDLKNFTFDSYAISIGNFAVELLAVPGRGRVMGVTSRGFFLLTGSDRVLFISTDPLFGPVHIIINVLPEKVKAGLMGAVVDYSPDELFFQNIDFHINLKNTKLWKPPILSIVVLSPLEREHQINLITDALVHSDRESTFLSLLQWMVAKNHQHDPLDLRLNQRIQTVLDLQQAVHGNEPGEAAKLLHSWIGFGPGLTPSGDDFIWGFLAALNRWKSVLCPQFKVGLLNESILSLAQKKTTSLSATLIECAVHGWADENMLAVLNRLFSGQGSVKETVEIILAYGSSSGVDAFAGMVVAVG